MISATTGPGGLGGLGAGSTSRYHRLSRIEKSFRMSQHDLQARPTTTSGTSIEAHLTIVGGTMGTMRGAAVAAWIGVLISWRQLRAALRDPIM